MVQNKLKDQFNHMKKTDKEHEKYNPVFKKTNTDLNKSKKDKKFMSIDDKAKDYSSMRNSFNFSTTSHDDY